MESGIRLFSYGTLQEEEIQRILFNGPVRMVKAALMNWRIYTDAGGFHFIREERGFKVFGSILHITKEQLAVADLWEEVPAYERFITDADMEGGGTTKVWVYTKPGIGGNPVEYEETSGHPIAQVVLEARILREQIQRNKTLDSTNDKARTI